MLRADVGTETVLTFPSRADNEEQNNHEQKQKSGEKQTNKEGFHFISMEACRGQNTRRARSGPFFGMQCPNIQLRACKPEKSTRACMA